MEVRGVHFAVICCLLAAFLGGLGEAQKVPPNTNEDTLNEANTISSNGGLKPIQTQDNSTSGIESSTTKPAINIGTNSTNDAVNKPNATEGPKTTDDSGQKNITKTLDPISVKIFRAEENGIWLSDMTLNKQISFKNVSHMKAFSVAYHYEKRLIFYATNDSIVREEVFGSKMTPGNSSVIALHGVDGPMSLAVDWVHDKLYWYSNRHSSVESSALDGNNRTLVIDSLVNTEYPSNIAVDPYEGYIFIVSNSSIYRAKLDGSDLTHIQPQGNETRAVKSVAVDTHTKRLYYTGKDGHYKTGQPYLASCDYRGERVQDLRIGKGGWNDIFSIGVFRDTLYFAHYPKSGPDTIWSVDLTEFPLEPKKIYSTEGGLWSIKIYHPKVQKKSEEVD